MAGLLYVLVALVVRLATFGEPAVQVDEQFYLLVGERMAQGALPYVDIWDRKPLGLFLIYRAVFLLPGDPVIVSQALACAFSVATAIAIERLARPIAGARGAVAAGLCYLLWQPVFNVATGQSPAFYNLLVAVAAGLVARSWASMDDPALLRRGALAMGLIGMALQIKTSVVFEGLGLGLLLLVRARRACWAVPRIAGAAAIWIALALFPTAAVFAWYAAIGQLEPAVQATALSFFGRGHDYPKEFADLAQEAVLLIPFGLAIHASLRRPGPELAYRRALVLWALFALGGFLIAGTWHDHYVGPLLVPLAVLSAPALGVVLGKREGSRWQGRFLLAAGATACVVATILGGRSAGNGGQVATATRLMAAELHGGCLYLHQGPTALYRLTGACLTSRYVFPSHLATAREATAIGIDADAELRRIIASRPAVIVTSENGQALAPNRESADALAQGLARGYERYAGVRIGKRRYGLYRRHS